MSAPDTPIATVKAYRRTGGAVVTIERQGRPPRRYVVSLRRYRALREWTVTKAPRRCKTSGGWLHKSFVCSIWSGLKRVALGVAVVALSACATCERHPVACTAAVAVIGASVALSLRHDSHSATPPRSTTCENDPAAFPNGCHAIM